MRNIFWITVGVVVVLSVISLVFTIFQAREERTTLSADLEYRTRLLSESLRESIEPSYAADSVPSLQRVVDRFTDRERLRGIAVVNARGELTVASENLPVDIPGTLPFV